MRKEMGMPFYLAQKEFPDKSQRKFCDVFSEVKFLILLFLKELSCEFCKTSFSIKLHLRREIPEFIKIPQ